MVLRRAAHLTQQKSVDVQTGLREAAVFSFSLYLDGVFAVRMEVEERMLLFVRKDCESWETEWVWETRTRLTHTQIHTHTHTHTHTHRHRDIHTHTHNDIDTHTDIHKHQYPHTHRYSHTQIHMHTHTHTPDSDAHNDSHRYRHTHRYPQTPISTHTDIHTHTPIFKHTHQYLNTHTHTKIQTHTPIFTHTHTHTHRYPHNDIYTHTLSYSESRWVRLTPVCTEAHWRQALPPASSTAAPQTSSTHSADQTPPDPTELEHNITHLNIRQHCKTHSYHASVSCLLV